MGAQTGHIKGLWIVGWWKWVGGWVWGVRLRSKGQNRETSKAETVNTVLVFWHSDDRASWYILIIKPTRCTNFSNLFLEQNSTASGQFLYPSSGVIHCTLSNGARHKGYANCLLAMILLASSQHNLYDIYLLLCIQYLDSWWWTENLSETCRVLFQK
jgi:hypothetical protein